MYKCIDGTEYKGDIVKGQSWKKDDRMRDVVDVNEKFVYFLTYDDKVRGTESKIHKELFENWINSGAVLELTGERLHKAVMQEDSSLCLLGSDM